VLSEETGVTVVGVMVMVTVATLESARPSLAL
jgi:hypothetical protein